MDSETIANLISALGKADFGRVVLLVLTRVFGLTAVRVDGPGDGGSDWRVLKDSGGSTTVAYQETVQDRGWRQKALEDARKARAQLGATCYFFLTSRSHTNVEFLSLQHDIATELRMPATCLGAKEIASFLHDRAMVDAFLDAIGAPLARGLAARPDLQEVLLHAYAVFGPDTQDLRASVYDDTLLLVLHTEGDLARGVLVAKAAALLQVNETRADFLSRRLDSLLTRGQVVAVGPQLRVAHEVKHELENAERVYLSELHLLAERQRQFLETTFQLSWSQEDALMASSLIARAFIQRQLATTRDARVALTALGLTKHIGDPLQLLREYLAEKGVHRGSVESVLSEFMEQAKDLPIVQKLTRAAVFVAIEGADPVSAAKAIGAARWVDVKVMLDASVAIPCLCAKIYRPTSNRFSLLSERAVATLAGLGAQVCTLVGYLNECASHLLRAVEYDRLDRFDSALRYSTNAYVSAYYQLRADGADLPDSLVDFLAYFAPSCKVPSGDKALWIRKVMAEIQPKFARYRIAVEEAGAIGPEYTRDIENAYVHGLRDAGRQKHSMLIDHDVVALGYVRRQIAKAGQSWILLTWDRHVMRAGEEFQDCGWVVSPDVAADFAQPSRAVSESGLCALAHAIARTRDRPLEIAARMIDRVVAIAGARMQDWQFQKELDDFRKGLLQRMDLNAADYDEWVDWETDRFLAEAGHEGEATAKEQR